jgi:hypothetical protein
MMYDKKSHAVVRQEIAFRVNGPSTDLAAEELAIFVAFLR